MVRLVNYTGWNLSSSFFWEKRVNCLQRWVRFKGELLLEIWKCLYWGAGKISFQFTESSWHEIAPIDVSGPWIGRIEYDGYLREVFDDPSVTVSQPQKALQRSLIKWSRSNFCCYRLFWVNCHTVRAYSMAKELHHVLSKFTHGYFQPQWEPTYHVENDLQVGYVFIHGLLVYNYIVQVHLRKAYFLKHHIRH